MQLQEYLKQYNFEIEPVFNGKIIRFDRERSNNAWFAGKIVTTKENKNIRVAVFGDWATGERYDWIEDEDLTAKERNSAFTAKTRLYKEFEAEQETLQIKTAEQIKETWTQALEKPTAPSEYMDKKNLPSDGRFGEKYVSSSWGSPNILIPIKDHVGQLWGAQTIFPNGEKSFSENQKVKGCYHQIGVIDGKTKRIFIAEGFATAATINLATQSPTITCFNAANLESVAKRIRETFPNIPITICGDDDRWTQRLSKPYNPGREAAIKAATICSGNMIFPHFKNLEKKPTDFNDLYCLEGLDVLKSQLEAVEKLDPSEAIETEYTGFHKQEFKQGKILFVPQYEDLRRYFQKKTHYKMLGSSKICFKWNGEFYDEMPDIYLEGFAQQHFKPNADSFMTREFKSLVQRTNLTDTEWFDETSFKKVNFKNCILDLQTRKTMERTPEYGLRYVLNYNYDPEAICPTFDKFMKDVFCGDETLINMVLEYIGYAMSNDDYWIHKALVLEGSGSNGKSTLIEVIKALIGPGNYCTANLENLKKEQYLQRLDGKLLNIAEETPIHSLKESSLFKILTSGGEVDARMLFKSPYSMKNRAKFIFACNELPAATDTTHGFIRRFLVAPFNVRFSHETNNIDPFILSKILKEMPGIFNRVIAAYYTLSARGDFVESQSSIERLEDYKNEIDPTANWITDTINIHPLGNGHDDSKINLSDLYSNYKKQFDEKDLFICNEMKFIKRLSKVIPNYEERSTRIIKEGKRIRIIKGVTLKDFEEPPF